MDAFQVLGIPVTSDREQIRTAYRALARRWHPDRFMRGARARLGERQNGRNQRRLSRMPGRSERAFQSRLRPKARRLRRYSR